MVCGCSSYVPELHELRTSIYPRAMEEYIFGLREGPKISRPHVYGLIVVLNC